MGRQRGSITKVTYKTCVRYRVILDLGLEHGSGKRIRRSKNVDTQRAARALLAQWSVETAPDILTRRSLRAYAAEWMDVKAQSVESTTMADYRWHVEKHILPSLGERPLRELATTDIAAFLANKTRSGLSATSVRKLRGLLVQMCQHAVDVGYLTRNPASLTKPPRKTRYEYTTWEAETILAFLQATDGEPMYPVWAVALLCGLRRGELVGLRWRDLNWDKAFITVKRTVAPLNGRKSEKGTKNQSSQRRVPMPPYVVQVLAAHQARQRQARENAGNKWRESGAVFTGDHGDVWHPDYVSRCWHDRVRDLKLPQMRLHDARHTAATHLLEAGVSLPTVAAILGHASTRMTSEVYAHALTSSFDGAAEKMSVQVFGEPTE